MISQPLQASNATHESKREGEPRKGKSSESHKLATPVKARGRYQLKPFIGEGRRSSLRSPKHRRQLVHSRSQRRTGGARSMP